MINFSKFHKNITLIPLFITLVCCQLKEPVKNHGILFLENRSNQLKISEEVPKMIYDYNHESCVGLG